MAALRRLEEKFGWLLRAIPVTCLALLLFILAANIVGRFLQLWSIAWFDEIVQGLFAWMVFIGAAALWREGQHFAVAWLGEILKGRARQTLAIFVAAASLIFFCAMTWYGWKLTGGNAALTPILKLPVAWLYACIPLSGLIMLGYSLVELVTGTFRLFGAAGFNTLR